MLAQNAFQHAIQPGHPATDVTIVQLERQNTVVPGYLVSGLNIGSHQGFPYLRPLGIPRLYRGIKQVIKGA